MLFRSIEIMPVPPVERGPEKMENYLEKISRELRENGFPVTRDCRIDIEAFKGRLYPPETVEKDKNWIEEIKKEYRKPKLKPGQARSFGEQLELYITAMFNKHLGKDFFVFRTSEYDDFKNHVDNLIIDRKTGNPICAFDEISEMRGPSYEEKTDKVLARNLGVGRAESGASWKVKGGARIKYGLKIRQEGEKTKIGLSQLENVPIFYLALSKNEIENGVKEFTPSLEETSEYERRMFGYFITSLKSQISRLELREEELNPKLRERLKPFKEKLNEIKT